MRSRLSLKKVVEGGEGEEGEEGREERSKGLIRLIGGIERQRSQKKSDYISDFKSVHPTVICDIHTFRHI